LNYTLCRAYFLLETLPRPAPGLGNGRHELRLCVRRVFSSGYKSHCIAFWMSRLARGPRPAHGLGPARASQAAPRTAGQHDHGTPLRASCLVLLIHALGWAGTPRCACGEARLPHNPSASCSAPQGLGKLAGLAGLAACGTFAKLASHELGVPLNPTNYLRRQIGFSQCYKPPLLVNAVPLRFKNPGTLRWMQWEPESYTTAS
jgi:hypothetical protein